MRIKKTQTISMQNPNLIYSGTILALIFLFIGLMAFSSQSTIQLSTISGAEATDLSYLASEEIEVSLRALKQQNLASFGEVISEREPLWIFKDGKGKLFSLLFFKQSSIPFIVITAHTDNDKIPAEELLKQADNLGPKLYQVLQVADLINDTGLSNSELEQLAQVYKKKSNIDVNQSLVLKRVVPIAGEDSFIRLNNSQAFTFSIIFIGGALLTAVLLTIYQVFFRSKKRRLARQFGAALVEMGLLIALIAVICVAAVRETGQKVNCSISKSSQAMQGDTYGMMTPETSAACCTQGYWCTASIPSFCGCM